MEIDRRPIGNLGTVCGMRVAAKDEKVKAVTTKYYGAELEYASHITRNGTHLIGVHGHETPWTTYPFIADFAYRPLLITVHRKERRWVVVLVLFVLFGAPVICVVALAGCIGFFLCKRRAASKSVMYGEFTPLTGTVE